MRRKTIPSALTAGLFLGVISCTAQAPQGGGIRSDLTSSTAASRSPFTFDDQTTRWFTAYCVGAQSMRALALSNPTATPSQLGEQLKAAGSLLTASGQQLEALPPPTVTPLDTEAGNITAAFKSTGPAWIAIGTLMMDAQNQDPAATSQYLPQIQQAFEPIGQAAAKSGITAAIQIEIDKIKECMTSS